MTERVRAIIKKGGKILLIKRVKEDETYWVFPGGAMEDGESYEEAVKRECLEELGVDIRVGKFFFRETSAKPEIKGQIEHFYLCEIVGGKIGPGEGPEYQDDGCYTGKYVIEWVDLEKLAGIDLRPNKLRDMVYKKYAK